jgi:hypothetical protein
VFLAKKRSTTWIGDKVHLTETCDADRPRLITHVATTLAPIADRDALGSIHADLAAHDLLPDTHLVDAGYVDADLLLASTRDHAVTLLGPSPQDTQWQSRQSGAFRLQSPFGKGDISIFQDYAEWQHVVDGLMARQWFGPKRTDRGTIAATRDIRVT